MFQQRRPTLLRRSREEWRSLVEEYEACDMPQTRFCAEHGLSGTQLRYWRKRFLQEASAGGDSESLIDFLELPLVSPKRSSPAPVPTPAPAGDGDWRVELDLGGGMVLRLR